MEVHDAAHVNVARGASQAHVILTVHNVPIPFLLQQENQESGAQQVGGRDKQHNVHGTAGFDENAVEPDDDYKIHFG